MVRQFTGDYGYLLVALSTIIAVLASYTALSFPERARPLRRYGVVGGALALGIGIWSIHFIGMSAFELPAPVRYAPTMTVVSLALAIAGALLGQLVRQAAWPRAVRSVVGGACIGLGICSMHYVSMQAMSASVRVHHDADLVVLTVLIAVAGSSVALALGDRAGNRRRLPAALALGLTIAAMHYTALSGARFTAGETVVLDGNMAGLAVVTAVAVMVILTLLCAGVQFDVRRARHSAKVSERRFKSLFQAYPDAVLYIALDGTVLDCNAAACRMFGWESDEVRGRSYRELVDETEHDRLAGHFERVLAGESRQDELTVRCEEERVMELSLTLAPIVVEKRVIGVFAVASDKTAYRETMRTLEATRRELQSTLHLQQGMTLKFVRQGDRFVHTFADGALLYRIGLSPERVIGAKLRDVFEEATAERLEQAYRQVWEGEESAVCEGEHGGRTFLASLRPVRLHGQVREAIVSCLDITEQKLAEEELRKLDKLKAVGQLAAGLAHEIRNPLTSLRGFAQLMRPAAGEKRRYFDIMLEELERINEIVSEFLVVANPQAVNRRNRPIGQLLRKAVELMSPEALLHNVRLNLAVWTVQDPVLDCSEAELKQVFVNVIKNAIEAMPGGGDVDITLETDDAGRVAIRIRDYGVGIPEALQPMLGEPFFTTKEAGTGLGLMMCYKIVQAHHGQLRIVSREGAGTTVEIVFHPPRAADAHAG